MIRRLFPRLTTSAWWFICLESLAIAAVNAFGQDQSPAPLEKFKTLAQRLAAEPADDCHRDSDRWPSGHPEELESELFDQANKFLCGSLNSDSRQGLIAADEALKTLRSISDDLHHNWPEYRRFRYEILDEAPLILVKITFRSRAIATAFAVPNEAYGTERVLKPNAAWQANRYFEGNGWDRGGGEQSIDLYPLARGASKRARYLIKLTSTGCGSGIGVEYTAYEWNPEGAGSFDQLLHRSGSVSLGGDTIPEKKTPRAEFVNQPLPASVELKTSGKQITLPFCWFSVVDTYNSPTLCMADTYDLSSDTIHFVRREVNRPDLYAVAKAIHHAQNGELRAVRAYTASYRVAKEITKASLPFIYNESTTVTHFDSRRELIRLEGGGVREFEMKRVSGSWLITRFMMPEGPP